MLRWGKMASTKGAVSRITVVDRIERGNAVSSPTTVHNYATFSRFL
jgi:hypothetical protein